MKESIEQQIAAAKHCMGCMHEGFIFMEEPEDDTWSTIFNT